LRTYAAEFEDDFNSNFIPRKITIFIAADLNYRHYLMQLDEMPQENNIRLFKISLFTAREWLSLIDQTFAYHTNNNLYK